MEKIFRYFLITFLIISFSKAQVSTKEIPWATGKSKGEDLQVFLVTISPGDVLTDWWGHVGLAIRDTTYGITRVYNFGLFSFNEGFVEHFVMGRLIFWAGDASLRLVTYIYRNNNRTISTQLLDINNDKKLILAQKLAESVLPENSRYLYHHYNENCATRLRDLIDQAIDGQLKKQTSGDGRLTFRQHTLRYSARSPLMQWLLMFLMNDSIDKPIKQWDEMFLPDELAKYISQTSIVDSTGKSKPLVKSNKILFDSKRDPVPYEATNWPLWTIVSGLLIALGAFLLMEWTKRGSALARITFIVYNLIFSLIIGFIGLVLFFMGLFTDHLVTQRNENLFLANPITFLVFGVALFALFKPSEKWEQIIKKSWIVLAILSIVLVFLKIFPMFDQDNLMIISLLLPINIGFAIAWIRKESNHFL